MDSFERLLSQWLDTPDDPALIEQLERLCADDPQLQAEWQRWRRVDQLTQRATALPESLAATTPNPSQPADAVAAETRLLDAARRATDFDDSGVDWTAWRSDALEALKTRRGVTLPNETSTAQRRRLLRLSFGLVPLAAAAMLLWFIVQFPNRGIDPGTAMTDDRHSTDVAQRVESPPGLDPVQASEPHDAVGDSIATAGGPDRPAGGSSARIALARSGSSAQARLRALMNLPGASPATEAPSAPRGSAGSVAVSVTRLSADEVPNNASQPTSTRRVLLAVRSVTDDRPAGNDLFDAFAAGSS